MEGMSPGAGDWVGGVSVSGDRVSVWEESSGERCGVGGTAVEVCLVPQNRHLQVLELVNFMLGVFYPSNEEKKEKQSILQLG